ncbi:MAG: DEAD/DEAH box helicase [Opitutales bacterium]|jgi:ATP-dependent RNA helicase DeaD|nr:DEAD/DEAH box helicase [Opitutales bacterium]
MSENTDNPQGFSDLGLSDSVMKVLEKIGYETPSPIQAAIIPHVLEGKDVIGQAQTGTGKTAAFALPLLSTIDVKQIKQPQVLVLTPTRELAIQVAEAFQKYAGKMSGFHVVPIYGGQDFGSQLRQLKRGVHVIVGTPGRVMDHMRRETLDLRALKCIVLDEADEMLRMGFIDDVDWIMEKTPDDRQVALFSATVPEPIKRIARRHLTNPVEISIKNKTTTADTIRQRYWMVSGLHKLDALTRVLEGEEFDAMIIFVRTKIATADLAERLKARGFAAAPLSGDIAQIKRERTVNDLKKGKLDILVATDVAARGLDVDRVSHVVNYDIPYDNESYVHRIGRTGRAGRKGDAILFVAPREKRLLKSIERATNNRIELMDMPTTQDINNKRIDKFKTKITEVMAEEGLEFFTEMIEQYRQEKDVSSLEIAAALAKIAQGDEPLLLEEQKRKAIQEDRDRRSSRDQDRGDRGGRGDRGRGRRDDRGDRRERSDRPTRDRSDFKKMAPAAGTDRFRIEVGRTHGVAPGHIVGAIANEAGLDSKHIGRIELYDDHSTVDLPSGMPREVLQVLKKTWVSGQQMRISRMDLIQKKSRGKGFEKEMDSGE